ncbi:PAS domain S-box protein [Ramlibacter henchirensis]|uniref:histidine kinase n=1 Tax=Ramlibacter henchirensis TaxID=204072 RepID=A0A4Z0C2Y8_9BURK|nr:PAS domain S-box protein [Ramlibacter henchirensis]
MASRPCPQSMQASSPSPLNRNEDGLPGALAEETYRAFFESTDEGACIVRMIFDEDGRAVDFLFLQTNASFEQHTGLKDVCGKRRSELPPGQSDRWMRALGNVATSGESVQVSDFSAALGRWFDLHAFRVGDPAQAVVAVRLRDITEQRQVQERLASLYGLDTVGVLFWGSGFALLETNDGFLKMSGYTREEAIGKTWQEFTPPEFHAASQVAVWEVSNLGEATPYEKEYIRKDGSRFWGLFAARKVGDEVVEFVLDVTQRRKAEAALRDADRRKDEFLATLAHELRNPLAPLRNGLQIMRLSSPAEAPVQRTVQMMERQLGHLVRLVDDLLDVARITSGKVRVERQVIALREVLARSIEATHAAMEAKQHRLQVDVPGEEVHVEGDLDRLAQVFSNLLSNAAKYTPAGGQIRLHLAPQPAEVVVSVTDNGIGIPAGQQERVFRLFTQVRDHQSHFEGGLGIGLSLVESLVHMHGGAVWVESPGSGQGSRFCVRLPRVDGARAGSGRHDAERPRRGPLRILVADDNLDAAESLAFLLQADGHEVVTAANGLEAVEHAIAKGPQLALLDLGMPVMDGLDAARRIRAAGARIRLVALTGWGQPADRERTREAGFDLHLVKPLTQQSLDQALSLVEANAAREESRRNS